MLGIVVAVVEGEVETAGDGNIEAAGAASGGAACHKYAHISATTIITAAIDKYRIFLFILVMITLLLSQSKRKYGLFAPVGKSRIMIS